MNFRTYALALACAALFGCSSSSTPAANKPPVVDAVDMPATAAPVMPGIYEITGSLTFHDDDDTVPEVHLQIVGSTTVTTTKFPSPQVMSGKAPLLLSFRGTAATPGLVVNYELSVVDSRGLESEKSMKTLTLQ